MPLGKPPLGEHVVMSPEQSPCRWTCRYVAGEIAARKEKLPRDKGNHCTAGEVAALERWPRQVLQAPFAEKIGQPFHRTAAGLVEVLAHGLQQALIGDAVGGFVFQVVEQLRQRG